MKLAVIISSILSMKRFLLCFSLLTAITEISNAQVSKAGFLKLINDLSDNMAKGNNGSAVNTLEQLDVQMQTQLKWLQTRIDKNEQSYNSEKAKATTDIDNANKAKTRANTAMVKAQQELNANDPNAAQDIEKATHAIDAAKSDEIKANLELENANKLGDVLNIEKGKLQTGQTMYNDIKLLNKNFEHSTRLEKDKIIADLKGFSAIL